MIAPDLGNATTVSKPVQRTMEIPDQASSERTSRARPSTVVNAIISKADVVCGAELHLRKCPTRTGVEAAQTKKVALLE